MQGQPVTRISLTLIRAAGLFAFKPYDRNALDVVRPAIVPVELRAPPAQCYQQR